MSARVYPPTTVPRVIDRARRQEEQRCLQPVSSTFLYRRQSLGSTSRQHRPVCSAVLSMAHGTSPKLLSARRGVTPESTRVQRPSARARAQRGRQSLSCRAANDTSSEAPLRILVLGGGFGGLYAALRLDSLPWPGRAPEARSRERLAPKYSSPSHKPGQVTLVDRGDRFVFKPLLYELLTEQLDEAEARVARFSKPRPSSRAPQVAPPFAELLAGTRVRCARSATPSTSSHARPASSRRQWRP
jgi:hypothetical protein